MALLGLTDRVVQILRGALFALRFLAPSLTVVLTAKAEFVARCHNDVSRLHAPLHFLPPP